LAHPWGNAAGAAANRVADAILAEVEACQSARPNNHVRLLGLDNFVQCAGASMVLYRGKTV